VPTSNIGDPATAPPPPCNCPGHVDDLRLSWEERTYERRGPEKRILIAPAGFRSQVIEGGKGTTFYVTTSAHHGRAFDHNPTCRHSRLRTATKNSGQRLTPMPSRSRESHYLSFFPRTQQPPGRTVAKVADDFWHPKACDGLIGKNQTTPKSPWKTRRRQKPRTKHPSHITTATNRVEPAAQAGEF